MNGQALGQISEQATNFISTIWANYGDKIIIAAIVIGIMITTAVIRSFSNGGLNSGFKIAIFMLIASIVFSFLQIVAFPTLCLWLTRVSWILAGFSFLWGVAIALGLVPKN